MEDTKSNSNCETNLEDILNNSMCFSKTIQDDAKSLEEIQKEIQLKMLQSTQKSLRVLEISEREAVSTTRELSVQHEQLKKVNNDLDELNTTLKKNNETIKAVKSGFIKNAINVFVNTFRVKVNG
jgi:CBS-domain-containing membrane protein